MLDAAAEWDEISIPSFIRGCEVDGCIVTVVPGNISRVQKPNKCHHHKQNTGCFKLTHSFPFPFLAFFFCGHRAVSDAVCIVGIP